MKETTTPLRSFRHQGLQFHVYAHMEEMGAASARALAERQIALAADQDSVGFLIMAAPSAFAFYSAYLALAADSAPLRDAIARTRFFQFDDYPLPASHPATFRYLLEKHLFNPLRSLCPSVNFCTFDVDSADPSVVCRDYTEAVLRSGPDLQLKGVGENGHWGFHEPGVPLSGPPAYIRVALSKENAEQQLRDHPTLFRSRDQVPCDAYTANVPLFLRTRDTIEDNVPQASKAFALLAGYATAKVDAAVPTSALKAHPNATVRTTAAAAWAFEEYLANEKITSGMLAKLAASLGQASTQGIENILDRMGLRLAR